MELLSQRLHPNQNSYFLKGFPKSDSHYMHLLEFTQLMAYQDCSKLKSQTWEQ